MVSSGDEHQPLASAELPPSRPGSFYAEKGGSHRDALPIFDVAAPVGLPVGLVGDEIRFSGSAADPENGALPASALSWSLILHHCSLAGPCHEHPLQEFSGVASGRSSHLTTSTLPIWSYASPPRTLEACRIPRVCG